MQIPTTTSTLGPYYFNNAAIFDSYEEKMSTVLQAFKNLPIREALAGLAMKTPKMMLTYYKVTALLAQEVSDGDIERQLKMMMALINDTATKLKKGALNRRDLITMAVREGMDDGLYEAVAVLEARHRQTTVFHHPSNSMPSLVSYSVPEISATARNKASDVSGSYTEVKKEQNRTADPLPSKDKFLIFRKPHGKGRSTNPIVVSDNEDSNPINRNDTRRVANKFAEQAREDRRKAQEPSSSANRRSTTPVTPYSKASCKKPKFTSPPYNPSSPRLLAYHRRMQTACYKCEQPGHWIKDCDLYKCWHCNKYAPGYLGKDCPEVCDVCYKRNTGHTTATCLERKDNLSDYDDWPGEEAVHNMDT